MSEQEAMKTNGAITQPASGQQAPRLSAEVLYSQAGLQRLDEQFRVWLQQRIPQLAARLVAARQAPDNLSHGEESELLVGLAPELELFLTQLFGIESEVARLRACHLGLEPLFEAKKRFVIHHALRRASTADIKDVSGPDLLREIQRHMGVPFSELAFAKCALAWLSNQNVNAAALSAAVRYTAWAVYSAEGRERHRHGVLFRIHGKHDPQRRVPMTERLDDGVKWLHAPTEVARRQREGFALADPGCDFARGVAEAKYCILCHNQGRDSCSNGAKSPHGAYAKSDIGVLRTGCPLGEKISEMHEVRMAGYALAALAIICVDNPLVAGTGHRICNDCMVGCIYENENLDPVDVPQSETRILKDVLGLPWGFEIYSLLTRWNPLNLRRPVPRQSTGRTVLVVGLGPAGYTLGHHLMNEGHAVVAIDGLKIEPLPAALAGRDRDGRRSKFQLIRDAAQLIEPLDARVSAGFGGVGEYGITVRWDKNFLTMIRLLLERRDQFALYGGVRFGSTLTLDSARELGFDHIALCMGAGRPARLDIPNGLARGIRTASDFLMALQLTGAARESTLANLQIRLPVVVIGGGLTAIDACTEALAYYPVQVEKFLARYESLCTTLGEDRVRAGWSAEERLIAEEFLTHARALRAERAAAKREQREPDPLGLLQSWGGARIAYRRRLIESPAYRNHEEINKALEEGIAFGEQLVPVSVEVDEFGHARALRAKVGSNVDEVVVPARTILIAAGSTPNTVLAKEDGRFVLDGKYFQALDEHGAPVTPERINRPTVAHVLNQLTPDGPGVSFFGDLHPSFAGTVVGAMASAQRGYPILSRLLGKPQPRGRTFQTIKAQLDDQVVATVVEVEILGSNIVELCIRAPSAAREFRPGQFFRLQNFETASIDANGTTLATEGLAVTAAAAEPERGLLWLVVLEMGGSSNLVRRLQPGERVVLMGPTGEPTVIRSQETVLLAGGGLGNAVLFSIGTAFRKAGSRVLYFAGYRTAEDAFRREYLQEAADEIVWCVDEGAPIAVTRPQDHRFVGNIVQAMQAFAAGELGASGMHLAEVDRIIAIGSDRMMAAVKEARQGVLAAYLKPYHTAIASINSPMQCMMKEICGQCLQLQRDPATSHEMAVFSCANQDQDMDIVDFPALRARLLQNSLQEKLTRRWIEHVTQNMC